MLLKSHARLGEEQPILVPWVWAGAAQRLVWAAKQALGKAALGALFA